MTGEETFYILVASIIFWCVNKKFGYKLGFALLTSTIVNNALKDIVNSPRPIGISGIRSLRIETATGQSFPSGHTQGSTTFWVSCIIQIKKKWIYIVGILVIILVGFSRMYLGVHYPIDVIGGIVIGIIWIFLSNYIFDYAQRTRKPLDINDNYYTYAHWNDILKTKNLLYNSRNSVRILYWIYDRDKICVSMRLEILY